MVQSRILIQYNNLIQSQTIILSYSQAKCAQNEKDKPIRLQWFDHYFDDSKGKIIYFGHQHLNLELYNFFLKENLKILC